MLYIFNKLIPDTKKIEYSLQVLYGINKYKSNKICKKLGINPQITINQIKKNHVNKLINFVNKKLKVESFLREKLNRRFNKLLEIKLIRALRAKQGLPVRGQRTHTNAKTIKYLKRGIKKKKKVGKKKLFKLKKKNYDKKKKKILKKKKKKKF